MKEMLNPTSAVMGAGTFYSVYLLIKTRTKMKQLDSVLRTKLHSLI